MTRTRRPFLHALSILCTWPALAVTAAWLCALVLTDRFHALQYLWWAPAVVMAPALLLLLLCAAVLARAAGRAAGQAGGRGVAGGLHAKARGAAWVVLACAVALCVWEARLLRLPRSEAATPGSVRIMAWNPSVSFMDDFHERLLALRPDVVAIANNPARAQWTVMREEMGPASDAVRFRRLTILARYPVVRWGGTSLGVTGARPIVHRWPNGEEKVVDDGHALFAELDTTPLLGRNIIVWAVDLPSDPALHRMKVMREAAEALATFSGPVYRRTADGLDQPEDPDLARAEWGGTGFPTPDFILGDFNTPRGSASLSLLLRRCLGGESAGGGYVNAHEQAGRGLSGTWPREYPLFAIDNLFIGGSWRAKTMQTPDPGAGVHSPVVADVVLRGVP